MLDIIITKQDIPKYLDHEHVYRFSVPSHDLKGFIAIHNTHLGPAVGGTRMYPYQSEEAALQDVLRLSKSMTSKCAIAQVPYGGGKAVIIGSAKQKSRSFWHAYAEVVNRLQGQFFTGADVGVSESDVQYMLEKSKYFIGRSNLAGDPSPYASLSTFYAITVATHILFDGRSLQHLKVAVRGVGKVGSGLVRLLTDAGADIVAADINKSVVDLVHRKYPQIKFVPPEKIFFQHSDVYAPCAMGNEFTLQNINNLKVKLICGGANNQLQNEEVGDKLHELGIIYIPDYVANAGGLIDVVGELDSGGYHKEKVLKHIEIVKDLINEILQESIKSGRPPYKIANQIVYQRVYVK